MNTTKKMLSKENFALKLCGLLQTRNPSETLSAKEWRLVGQEQNNSQLFTWISQKNDKSVSNVGMFSFETTSLEILHTFDEILNIIQASVNDSQTLLGYVVKQPESSQFVEQVKYIYKPFIVELKSASQVQPISLLAEGSNKQIMVQFLYKSGGAFVGKTILDKFILFIHMECIKYYCAKLERDGIDDYSEETWTIKDGLQPPDVIVKSFLWAQWDCVHQVLYFIHFKSPVQSYIEGDDCKKKEDITPTLSALQFHQDLPHETVLNIPLNLPQLPSSNDSPSCYLYEDDAVPLRIHDCSLDLQIVTNPLGIVCICHHYLYQPSIDEANVKCRINPNELCNEVTNLGVHFAYSITLFHHGYVTHCVIPDLMWPLAKSLRPTYCLYNDDYLLIHLPNLYTHMLDIGLSHEPNCHMVLPANSAMQGDHLVSLLTNGKHIMVDLITLDIVKANVPNSDFISVFKSKTTIQNKLSILHYFLQHDLNIDVVEELITEVCNNSKEALGVFCAVVKEFLIGGTYITTKHSLPSPASDLIRLLPYTTNNKLSDVKMGEITVSVSQEQLWNTTMMLLSPRQRIAPFRTDMWTRIWEYLTPVTNRFKPHQVLEKLKVSLACYQPEALSRCSTPISPAGPPPATPRRPLPPSLLTSSTIHDSSVLPFIEVDTCTASKQEHIISVNLREISMHLLRHGGSRCGPSVSSDGAVHSVGARYAAAQLEASRALCLTICKALNATPRHDQYRGFTFIDNMDEDHRMVLLKGLETYYLAADSLAFPLPQGFSSFFTYLGYKTLSFAQFLQYVHRNVFEIQIDFLKLVMAEAGNDINLVQRALRLAALGGGARSGRALSCSSHPAALRLRARHHAATLLAGLEPPRGHLTTPLSNTNRRGLAAFPSADRLSPLDTFLDLLTAKASLNELDFNLLIDATILAESSEK